MVYCRENPWFAKSLVQRLWMELVGEGFFDAIDDIGPDRETYMGETLYYLAENFIYGGYDLKWLFRTIMVTDAYQRVSQVAQDPEHHSSWRNHPKRLRSDQLFNALQFALDIPDVRQRKQRQGIAAGPREFFSRSFGFDPSLAPEEINGSVAQALQLMNSQIISRLASSQRLGSLGGMLRAVPVDQELIEELYLRCYSRPPTRSEQRQAVKYVKRSPSRADGFEDLLVALVNSSEFLHRS